MPSRTPAPRRHASLDTKFLKSFLSGGKKRRAPQVQRARQAATVVAYRREQCGQVAEGGVDP